MITRKGVREEWLACETGQTVYESRVVVAALRVVERWSRARVLRVGFADYLHLQADIC
jgi:hypothetical protein